MSQSTSHLGLAIREIRKRRGQTMAEFATLIGCKQSTVSRYESGRMLPGRAVLMLILQFASPKEAAQLRACIGVELSDSPAVPIEPDRRSPHASSRNESGTQTLSGQFSRLAEEVLQEPGPDAPVIEVLRLWVEHRHDPRLAALFCDLAAYLRVELTLPPVLDDNVPVGHPSDPLPSRALTTSA